MRAAINESIRAIIEANPNAKRNVKRSFVAEVAGAIGTLPTPKRLRLPDPNATGIDADERYDREVMELDAADYRSELLDELKHISPDIYMIDGHDPYTVFMWWSGSSEDEETMEEVDLAWWLFDKDEVWNCHTFLIEGGVVKEVWMGGPLGSMMPWDHIVLASEEVDVLRRGVTESAAKIAARTGRTALDELSDIATETVSEADMTDPDPDDFPK